MDTSRTIASILAAEILIANVTGRLSALNYTVKQLAATNQPIFAPDSIGTIVKAEV